MAETLRPDFNKTELLIERANQGDALAFDELITHVSRRLCSIAHGMLAKYPHVRRWEETDDVLQAALLRLHQSLTEVQPDSVGRFFGLAATQLRRILIDLSRHYYGVYGLGTNHQSDRLGHTMQEPAGSLDTHGRVEQPDSLEAWTAFHQAIERLDAPEKEAFSLMWYSGLTQRKIAQVLGVSERTVIRRMNRARIRLHDLLDENMPS